MGFVQLKDLTALSISEQLKKLLNELGLSPLDCVGQGYDGASVMSGIHGGVQAIMKASGYSNAHCVHYASHRLNLVLASAAEAHPDVKSFFDTMDMVYTFMTESKRHDRFIDFQRQMYPDSQPLELSQSCNTRWSSRSLEVEKFLRRFDVIIDTLASFENDRDTETKFAALSLLSVIQTKKFVILMTFFARLHDFTDACTKGLQKRETNVSSCIELIHDQKECLDHFDFQNVISFSIDLRCEKCEITQSISQLSRRLYFPNLSPLM